MKKGFTLIELLAVIVILAIIALIAIPQFTKVIENAKVSAGARSVEGHIESVNTEIAKSLLKGNVFNDGEILGLSGLGISTKGSVTCTLYNLKGNTVISASDCEANGYTYNYSMDKGAIIFSGSKGSKTDTFLMKENIEDDGENYRSSEWKDKIISVSFKNKINIPSNAVVTWDLSFLNDNSVVGYLVPSDENDMYDLIIAANGYIRLPVNSRALFKDLTKVKSYDFTNALTNGVVKLAYTFKNNKSLETLDLSSFDTSTLKYINDMLASCIKLKNLNISTWKPKLKGISGAFFKCQSLVSLNLTNFDVSEVTDFRNIFAWSSKLKTINISTWRPNIVEQLSGMFEGLPVAEEADLSGFTTFKDGYSYNAFFDTNSNIIIKTGNEDLKNKLKEKYPSLNIQ